MPSLLQPLTLLSLALAARAASVCNGHAEYCSRIYSNVSQVASHDSAFVGDLPTENQYLSVADQLTFGVRFFEGQTHENLLGTLDLCHTSCYEEDAGSVVTYLSTVKSFLDANPNEVVTLLLTNGDSVSPSLFNDAIQSSGIDQYIFTPSTGAGVLGIDDWPTLGDLIDAGTRLVFFLDYGANTTAYPYILDEFSYFFETPYDTTDPTFPECTLNRPAGASPDGRMYIVNHFLDLDILGIDVPDTAAIAATNAATGSGSIGAQVSICQGLYGHNPKAVFLDFIDQGQALQAELTLNGVS